MNPMLSLLIPSKGETEGLWKTVDRLHAHLEKEGITHEFVIVNDVKTADEGGTGSHLLGLGIPLLYCERLPPLGGFGSAIRLGLEKFRAPAVMIVMADGSEDPADVVRFYRRFEQGADCVFGDRFAPGGKIEGYPPAKMRWNRAANLFLRLLFGIPYRDFTNASKLYSRKAIDGMRPIFSEHFNVTIELPIKAFLRGYNVAVLPNSWRATDLRPSHLRLGTQAKRYLQTALALLLERWFGKAGRVG